MNKVLVASLLIMAASPLLCAEDLRTVGEIPVPAYEAWTRSWWHQRFEERKAQAETNDYNVVFVGDSITHRWEGDGKAIWEKYFNNGEIRALNLGFSGDRTEHVLWRINNGMFGKLQPKAIVVMIGTNNGGRRPIDEESPVDTIAGVYAVIKRINAICPKAKIILHPIFPRSPALADQPRLRNDLVNKELEVLARHHFKKYSESVVWCDFNSKLMQNDGSISREIMNDYLHLTEKGYKIWAEELMPYLDWALGKTKELPKENPPPLTAIPSEDGEPGERSKCGTLWFWDGRLQERRGIILNNRSREFDLVMIGDSITHGWDGRAGKEVFNRRFAGLKVLNLGFSGDRVNSAIWNVERGGMLDGHCAKAVMIMIGTNNSPAKEMTPEAVARGIARIVKAVRAKQPNAKVLLMPIFPREKKIDDPRRIKNDRVNELIRPLADGEKVIWFDINHHFVDADGKVDVRLMPDYLHPNAAGYEIWADELKRHIPGIK